MFDNDKNAVTFFSQIKLEVTSSFNRTQDHSNNEHEPAIYFFLMDEEERVKVFVLKGGILENFLLKRKKNLQRAPYHLLSLLFVKKSICTPDLPRI